MTSSSSSSSLLSSIDSRTKLAGTNKLEVLMFTLGATFTGRREVFGINVFKVREVMRIPPITAAPDMPRAVEGMVSLRGMLVPVIDLAKYLGMETKTEPGIMIVTEYNGHTQGFLVEAVDTILRLDWSAMRVPPAMLSAKAGGLVTAVNEQTDGKLVMMLDVERVLSEAGQFADNEHAFRSVQDANLPGKTVFFADDSMVARNQIIKTLDAMGVGHHSAVNGKQAWEDLLKIADTAEAAGKPIRDFIQVVLTDVEMPEMDGYMLTRKIKEDQRFVGIPVVMHSSLSSTSNQQLGKTVGVDAYIPKFEPQKLAQALTSLLRTGAV